MDSANLLNLLRTHGAKHVYNHVLLDENVFVLKNNFPEEYREKYHHFKVIVSDALGVPVKNIAIIGSSKTGYSLTPNRNFDKFGEQSDLDLVVVSKELFESLWSSHLDFKNSIVKSRNYSYSEVAKNIFRHFISVADKDIDASMLSYFSEWISTVGALKRTLEQQFGIPAEINYRVYDSWTYVELYHVTGLNSLLEYHLENN